MSLVTSRRSLILGVTSLVAFPMIARASSLMQLRGDLMDEWVVAFENTFTGEELTPYMPLYSVSQFDTNIDLTAGACLYRGGYFSQQDPLKTDMLFAMSHDPRVRARQLNLIRPYSDIDYVAMKKSEFDAANALYRKMREEKLREEKHRQ